MSTAISVSLNREVVGGPSVPELFSVRAATKRALLALITAWIPQSWWEQICRFSTPVWVWLWARGWRRSLVRLVMAWHLAGALLIVFASSASADPIGGGSLSPFFSWMDLKDSHGIDAWNFYLSIDKGNATPSGGWRMIWAFFISFEYEVFRFLMATAIWFITWVLSFEWLELILTPVRTISESVTSITNQFDLTLLMLTAAGFAAFVWIVQGRYSTGIYEILMSCVLAAAAIGILSNPVERTVGEDGFIMQARDMGLSIAAGLTNNGDTNGNAREHIDQIESKLVDTFIRQPTQLINFGRVLDAPQYKGQCVKEFDAALGGGPKAITHREETTGEKVSGAVVDTVTDQLPGPVADAVTQKPSPEDRLKNSIRDCEGGDDGGAMKEYADNPGPGQAIGLLFLIFAGFVLMLFAIWLAGRLMLAAGVAIGNAIKSIPGIVVAIAPAMRGQFWKTVANVAMAMAQMVFSIVFLVGYTLMVQSIFAADQAHLIRTVLFVDIFLIIGIVLFRRGNKGLRRMSDKLADKLAMRPNAPPVAITRSNPATAQGVANAIYSGRQLYRGGKAIAEKSATAAKATGHAAAATGKATAGVASTAATAGVAAAVLAGKTALKGAQTAKRGMSASGADSGDADAPATGQQVAAAAREAAVHRLSRAAVSDKAGIKHPVGTAPSPRSRAAARGTLRAGSGTAKSPDGQQFREFVTSSGALVMLPSTPPRSTQRRPVAASVAAPVAWESATGAAPEPEPDRFRWMPESAGPSDREPRPRRPSRRTGPRPSSLNRGQ